MRVLFSSTSDHGHVLPMVPLARAFVAAGHEVLWATGAHAHHLVAGAGVRTAPAGLTGAALRAAKQALGATASTLAPQDRAAFMFPHMFGATFAPAMLEDLLAIAEQWRPDLLVHEQAELASPIVGAVLGRPSVTHSYGGAIPPESVAEAGELLRGEWERHAQELPAYAGCFTSGYLDICPPSVQTVPTGHIEHAQPLRPLAGPRHEAADLPAYLEDDGRPLVYLTMGTVHAHTDALRTAVGAVSQLPVRLLVALGPHGDPADLGRQPSHVHVEPWVDQPLVLQHCAVVASHGGSGTFLGALAHGVPQLCLPQAADQFRNAAGGARVGAILALAPGDATEEAVALGVGRLLAEDGFGQAARRVAEEIGAMPSPDEVVASLRTAPTRAADAP
ncbi:MAG: glycosyltransferase [Nocardioidaceae bacterium]